MGNGVHVGGGVEIGGGLVLLREWETEKKREGNGYVPQCGEIEGGREWRGVGLWCCRD